MDLNLLILIEDLCLGEAHEEDDGEKKQGTRNGEAYIVPRGCTLAVRHPTRRRHDSRRNGCATTFCTYSSAAQGLPTGFCLHLH